MSQSIMIMSRIIENLGNGGRAGVQRQCYCHCHNDPSWLRATVVIVSAVVQRRSSAAAWQVTVAREQGRLKLVPSAVDKQARQTTWSHFLNEVGSPATATRQSAHASRAVGMTSCATHGGRSL